MFADVRFTAENGHRIRRGSCLLCADFVAEVGDDKSVAAGSNVLS
jgi:coenzyme F420-reducing hydrogenase beta subunit